MLRLWDTVVVIDKNEEFFYHAIGSVIHKFGNVGDDPGQSYLIRFTNMRNPRQSTEMTFYEDQLQLTKED